MERHLDEHDNEERHARHQTKEVKHQGMVLAPNIIEADRFCGIYNKYHIDQKDYPDGKCKVFVFGAPKRVYQDFIDKRIRTLVVVRRLLEGFGHNFVSVLGVIRKINPVSQVKFVHFLGLAVQKIDRKDPVKACIVTHQYFNLRRNCEEFKQLAKEDPQGDMVTVYMLDDSLIKEAENIKNFLESDYIIQMCPHTLDQTNTISRNISLSVSSAYQHYAQCSRVHYPVSNMTDMVDIRPFRDLVKLMPQSFSEFSHSEEFEEKLPAKLSQISEEYQTKVSVKLFQLSEENQQKLSKLQQLFEKELSDEYQKEISATLDKFSEKCQEELCVKLCRLFEEYQKELKQLLEKELSAKPHQLSVQNQVKLSAKLQQLSEKCQKELYSKLDQLTKEHQEKCSTKLPQLPEHYYKELSAKPPQLHEENVEELQAELSRVTLKEESEPSSDFATVQKVQIPDTSAAASSADVVVILGHSSVFSCGPFDTEELLVALTTKLKPTVIAFLSCCGGNNRYGPIYKMSHLLPQCLIGFYQRRVYVEELCKTSLVIGLRNYMYLQHEFKSANETTQEVEKYKRHTAIQAFACAKLSLESAHDPTVIVNDFNQNLIEIFIEITKDRGGRIPLSLLQLSMYHHIVVNSDMHPIDISMKSEVKKLLSQTTIEELDRNCISEIRKHRLHELVPFILELRLLKLYNESLDLIKTGDPSSWNKVDHLQFLLAMLRGYWGKNTLTVIREWATFHLMEMMGECDKLSDDKLGSDHLHKYKLCCVCYALLCEHHFVRFVEPGENLYKFQILACTRFFGLMRFSTVSVWYDSSDDIYSITCDGYIKNAKSMFIFKSHFLNTQGPYPYKGELPNNWYNFFKYCETNIGCMNMWSDYTNKTMWKIDSLHWTPPRSKPKYQYNRLDFALAMVALNEYLHFPDNKTPSRCYDVKDFRNIDSPREGYMQCFPQEYSLLEMRVIADRSKCGDLTHILNWYKNYDHIMARVTRGHDYIRTKLQTHLNLVTWNRLSACRFLFYRFHNAGEPNEQGDLYYTDNHYGNNLINADLLNNACRDCHSRLQRVERYVNKIQTLCRHCKFKLMKRMITENRTTEFPFTKLGHMTLRKSDTGSLYDITLQQVYNIHYKKIYVT